MIGKLLVVDDEAWFREGLVKLIGSNPLGWDVIGEAADGEEAMEAVELYQPDMVITDINMPVMDGLALTEWLSHAHPDIMVILLTGYRDFEYAQRALRYGAVEFLLKPFALDEAYRVFNKTHEQFRLKELAKRTGERERQTELFRAAISGLPCDRESREQWERRWARTSFCILQIDSYQAPGKNYTANDINLLHYAAANILQELLQQHQTEGIHLPLNKEEFAFLLEAGSGEEQFRMAVQEALKTYIGLQASWVHIGTVGRFVDIQSQYERIQGRRESSAVDAAADTQQLKEQLTALLVASDLSAAKALLLEYIDQAGQLELQPCKMGVYTLVTVFSSILLSDFKHLRAAFGNETLHPSPILDMKTVAQLTNWAKDKCSEFLNVFARWLEERQNNVVYQAKQYIEEQYREVCSLQAVAAYVHVTPNYLSNLFKKETGISFTTYVNQLRIDKAKALLEGTKMRMTEIAEEVGFDTSSYLTVVFKQITGQSPREFRKQFEE